MMEKLLTTSTTLAAKINNPSGIHARPSTSLIRFCYRHPDNKIEICRLDSEAWIDASSIISLMSLALSYDTRVAVKVYHDDHDAIAHSFRKLIESNSDDEFNNEWLQPFNQSSRQYWLNNFRLLINLPILHCHPRTQDNIIKAVSQLLDPGSNLMTKNETRLLHKKAHQYYLERTK